MNLLITGASGFVGSHLLQRFLEKGISKVSILLRAPENAWRLNGILEMPNLYVIHGSLNSPETYKKKLKIFRPDVVVNLAWAGVEGGERNSEDQWNNVFYMLELLKISHQCGAKRFIGFGSQGEYGNLNNKISEKDFERPTTVYGQSKLSAFKLGKVLADRLGIEFVWIRLFDPYGPKDGSNWFLSYIIKELLEGRSPKITYAEQFWDYIYIDDVVDAIIKIINQENIYGVFNLGSGKSIQLSEIVEKIRKIIGTDIEIQYGLVPYREDQIMHLEANIKKISSQINWMPLVEIDDGLEKTVNWWKSNLGL